MLNYLNYFFDPAHLFTIYPRSMSERAIIILIIIFGITIIVGVIAGMKAKGVDGLTAKGLNRLKSLGWVMGLLGLAYVWFAWQRITVLGGRFWLLIWFGIAVTWALFIVIYLKIEVPKKKQNRKKQEEFRKYLPKQG